MSEFTLDIAKMSGRYRNRTWHRQHPYENRAKSSTSQRETRQKVTMGNPGNQTPPSPCSSSSASASGERGWDYLLRRKAEFVNERILKAKAAERDSGTTEVFSQFVPIKQEPGSSPPINVSNQFLLSRPRYLQEMDSTQNYAAHEGFWIDTIGERYEETEPRQTFSQSTNAEERNKLTFGDHCVKLEIPWSYPDAVEGYGAVHSREVTEQSCGRNNPANQLSSQTLSQNFQNGIIAGNCDTKKDVGRNVIGNSLSVQRLISNIRNAVASNPSFKRSKHDSATNQTFGCNVPNDVDDTRSATTQSFDRNNSGNHPSEQALTQQMPNDIQDSCCATKEDSNGNKHDSFANQTLTCNMLNSSEDDSPAMKQNSNEKKKQGLASKTLIHSLPYPAEGVEVVYTVDPVEAEAWLTNNIVDCSAEVVGFDIEWKPQFVSKKKGGVENKTAVLQLGVESSCLVLHLRNMKAPPKLLSSILNDKKILKVGSGILQDVAKLKRDKGLTCKGLVDTQKMAKSLGTASQKLGLKALAEHFFGINVEKPKSISRSNWEKYPLTIRQIHYAALDAWIGFKLYQHMKLLKGQGQTHIEETQLVVDEDDENPVEIVVCHVCNKKCKGNDVLASHIKIHPQCKCGKFFLAKISKNHKKNCTKFNPVEIVVCHVCNKKCKGDDALANHIKIHAQCKCGTYFPVKVPTTHKQNCPELNSVASQVSAPGDKMFCCQACGKKCKYEEQLMKHIRDAGHVQCPFCTRLLHGSKCTTHIKRCRQIINEEWKQTHQ